MAEAKKIDAFENGPAGAEAKPAVAAEAKPAAKAPLAPSEAKPSVAEPAPVAETATEAAPAAEGEDTVTVVIHTGPNGDTRDVHLPHPKRFASGTYFTLKRNAEVEIPRALLPKLENPTIIEHWQEEDEKGNPTGDVLSRRVPRFPFHIVRNASEASEGKS